MIKPKHPWITELEHTSHRTLSNTRYTPLAFALTVANARLDEALARTAELEAQAEALTAALATPARAAHSPNTPEAVWPMPEITPAAFAPHL